MGIFFQIRTEFIMTWLIYNGLSFVTGIIFSIFIMCSDKYDGNIGAVVLLITILCFYFWIVILFLYKDLKKIVKPESSVIMQNL